MVMKHTRHLHNNHTFTLLRFSTIRRFEAMLILKSVRSDLLFLKLSSWGNNQTPFINSLKVKRSIYVDLEINNVYIYTHENYKKKYST